MKGSAVNSDILEHVPCNYCSADDYTVLFKGDYSRLDNISVLAGTFSPTVVENAALWQVVQCNRCGLRYTTPRLKTDIIKDIYAKVEDHLYIEEEANKRRTAQMYLRRVSTFIKPGRLLDIGCFAGFFLDEARKQGFEVMGIEPSDWARRFAREKLGLEVLPGFLEDSELAAGSLDCITAFQVLEHVPDAKELITRCYALLKPAGIILIDIPIMDSFFPRLLGRRWWFFKDMHTYHFTRETAIRYLTDAGFELLIIEKATKVAGMRFLIPRIKPYSNRIYQVAQRMIDQMGLQDMALKIKLGDIITIYAKKPAEKM